MIESLEGIMFLVLKVHYGSGGRVASSYTRLTFDKKHLSLVFALKTACPALFEDFVRTFMYIKAMLLILVVSVRMMGMHRKQTIRSP